jgi:hypothetical protein
VVWWLGMEAWLRAASKKVLGECLRLGDGCEAK